jgi:hypothetical protein
MKSAIGFRSFLLRGIKKVEGEFTLVCTAAYNLKRLFSLVAACREERPAALIVAGNACPLRSQRSERA